MINIVFIIFYFRVIKTAREETVCCYLYNNILQYVKYPAVNYIRYRLHRGFEHGDRF